MEKQYSSALQQIEAIIQDDGQFQAFQKTLPAFKTSDEIINKLTSIIGKKKAQSLGDKLFKQISSKRASSISKGNILQQIETQIGDQKDFKGFQLKIDTFETTEDVVSQLTSLIGKKKAQSLGERFYNEELKEKIKLKAGKSTLLQIKELVDEVDFNIFQQKVSTFRSATEYIKELTDLIGKKKAELYGEKLFRQSQKNKPAKGQALGNNQKNVSNVMSEIERQIGDDNQFKAFRIKAHNFTLVEDVAGELSAYMGKIKAKGLAQRLFKEMGKDRLVVNRLDYLYRDLRQRNIDGNTISKIMHLIDNGQKRAVQRNLMQILGPVGGKQMFEKYQAYMQETISSPVSDSKYINTRNGLQIYEYKQSLIEAEKVGAKTMIVFGQTGCGKSTFLNAIVNYLKQVEMEDPFRYKIIVENEDNQKASITSKITSYYIKNSRTNTVYRLIDTPGFGDTRGVEKDYQIVDMVKQTFTKQIDSVHNILFLVKAATTRVTPFQRYVFQSIMDLFNKDVAPNFVFIFTFSDSGTPQVLQSVRDPQYGFGTYWNQISDPKYLEVNNCGIFQKIDVNDKIKLGYWEIGMMCMQKLFTKVHGISAKSLNTSRDLLRKKQSLTNKMKVTQQRIQQAITKRENILKQIEKVLLYQDQIDNNKDFTYQVEVIEWYSQATNNNVTRCFNCLDSNCHQNCEYGNGQDKINCCAFDSRGYCEICPGKCHYTVHKNDHILRKTRTVKENRQNAVNKSIYENSCQQVKNSEAKIQQLYNNMETTMKTAIDATKQMVKLQQDLLKNQMSTKKPESTISYLHHLIMNEEKDRKSGYQGRIKNMQAIIHEMQFLESISTEKKSEQEMNKLLKGHQKKQFDQILKKAKPGALDKFGKMFSSF